MKHLINKLTQFKQWIIFFVRVRIFLLKSKPKQEIMIANHAKRFYKLQEKAKYFDRLGDLRESWHYIGLSYNELGWFASDCNVLKIDQVTKLKS